MYKCAHKRSPAEYQELNLNLPRFGVYEHAMIYFVVVVVVFLFVCLFACVCVFFFFVCLFVCLFFFCFFLVFVFCLFCFESCRYGFGDC